MQTQLAKTPKKSKKWLIIGVVVLVVIVIGVNVFLMQKKKDAAVLQFESVKQRTLSSTKLVSGQVVPGNTDTFFVDQMKGKVKEVFVKEGDEVKKGQKLFSYESTELGLQVKQAELDKKMIDMRVEQNKQKINALKSDMQKAKDAGAPDATIAPLDAQIQELTMQQKSTDLENEKNKLQMQELQKKQDDLIVYSNKDGFVQKLDKDASQSGQLGQAKPLMKIASKEPFQIQGTLTELQKSQIQKDQEVTITAKAIANKKWTGKITEISDYPTTAEAGPLTGDAQQVQTISNYSYKATLSAQDGLSPGFHVSLQVKLSEKKILAIPRSSVVEDGNSPYVFVNNKGKLQKQKVTTGLTDGDWIEVTEGVTEGQKVVKEASKDVKDGMEVKEND